MRFDRQHIAKLGDRIDLEALGVADNHGFKPLPRSEMNRGRMPQVSFDPVDLVLIIDGGADADVERTALRRGLGECSNRKGKRQKERR